MDVHAHIVKTKPRFGVPTDATITTAAYAQTEKAVRELTDLNVKNIRVKYNYWQKGGYYGKLTTDPKPLAALGGKKGIESLRNAVEQKGGGLYLTYEPLNAYKTGAGFNRIFDALKTIARTTQKQYKFSLANASADVRYDPWFLVRPQKINKFFDKYWNNFSKAGYGYPALDSIGETLYSELAADGINRDDVLNGVIKEQLAKTNSLMLNGAFGYAAVYADHVVNSPSGSSGLDIYDADVPFWQIVFHGCLDYSLGAINLSSNPGETALRALECGASPMYSWVFENADELPGSRSDDLYSADYYAWREQASSTYIKINGVLSEVSGEPITKHSRNGDVSVTEYGGKLTVACNYGDKDAVYNGAVIPAKGNKVL
jgi:hypothetical protein